MAQITLNDISLKTYELTGRVSNLKKNYFKSLPQICTERPRLITHFHLKNNLLGKQRISVLDKARAYRYVLENRVPIVRHKRAYKKGMKAFEFEDNNLFAGSTTSKFKGVLSIPSF